MTTRCAECVGDGRCKPCSRAYQERRRTGQVRPRRGPLSDDEKREYHREYYRVNREQQRDRNRQLRYGLQPGQYAEMRAAQNDRCAICGLSESRKTASGGSKSLGVDHDHVTGAVRSLLCVGCNVGLGGFGDDVVRLRAAIDYLERHRG